MFKKFTIYIAVLFIISALTISSASAITIGVNPLSQDVFLDDQINISIYISGLGDHSPDSLGIFNLDISFDDNILGFNNARFGDSALEDQLDIFGLGSIKDVTPGLGTVNLSELSSDFPDDLDNLQAGSFTLAVLSFETLASGESPLDISINTLGDAYRHPLSADILNGSVCVNAVPEPASCMLLLLGLIGISGVRKKA